MRMRHRIVLHTVVLTQGLDSRKEPGLVFAVGQHDFASEVTSLRNRPLLHLRRNLHGAVIVAVEDDKNGIPSKARQTNGLSQ